MGGKEVIPISSSKLLGLMALLLVALVAAGCSSNLTSTPPEGVSVMESAGRAEVSISTARWSNESSVQLEPANWIVVLYPVQANAEGSSEPTKFCLEAYRDLTVRFVDAKGTVVRSHELTRRLPEAPAE